jgi:hypothetical protein
MNITYLMKLTQRWKIFKSIHPLKLPSFPRWEEHWSGIKTFIHKKRLSNSNKKKKKKFKVKLEIVMGQPHNSPFDEVLQIQVDYLKRSKITSKHIWTIITWKDKGNPMSKDSTWNNKHVAKVIIKGCLEGFNRHSFLKVAHTCEAMWVLHVNDKLPHLCLLLGFEL